MHTDLHITSIPVQEISIDPALQPRVEGIDAAHVQVIQDAFELCPPIRVTKAEDRFVLLDGFHRYAAAQNLGLSAINAEIIDPKGLDLFAVAFNLNAAHGRPLTLSDRRNYAAYILKSDPTLSDREVGRRCGLMQPTVAKVRQDLERKSDIPVTMERVGRNGQTYSATSKKEPERLNLVDVINNVLPPSARAEQRKIANYLRDIAAHLEQQDDLPGYETINDAAAACKAVFGEAAASELAQSLGWSSRNIFQIAQAMGFAEEPEA